MKSFNESYENEIFNNLRAMYRSKPSFKNKLRYSRELIKSEPNSYWAKYFYAAILGDNAQYKKDNWKKELDEAVSIFSYLVKRLKGTPDAFKRAVRNEYFFHSGQYLKQYKLGIEEYASSGQPTSFFSSMVGSSMYAYEFFLKEEYGKAQYWAHISLIYSELYEKEFPEKAYSYSYFPCIAKTIIYGQKVGKAYINNNPNLLTSHKKEVISHIKKYMDLF